MIGHAITCRIAMGLRAGQKMFTLPELQPQAAGPGL
jgi:hypothetical protein